MSLADFSLFLPGSTNTNKLSSLKNSKNNKSPLLLMGSNSNNIKINLKKIQFNFKQLIDTIINLINEKKKLENEIIVLKTNSQKQKNMLHSKKNSSELLKYIGVLDDYLIQVNKTLKNHPDEKAEILSKIKERINKNFEFSNKDFGNNTLSNLNSSEILSDIINKNNRSILMGPSNNSSIQVLPKNNNDLKMNTIENILGPRNNMNSKVATLNNRNSQVNTIENIQVPRNNRASQVNNTTNLFGRKNNNKNIKYAKTLEELMGVNFEPNNNINEVNLNINGNVRERLMLNNNANNGDSLEETLLINSNKNKNNRRIVEESLMLNSNDNNGSILEEKLTLNHSKNNALGVKENILLNNSRNNGLTIHKKNNMNQAKNVNYETSIFNQKNTRNNNNNIRNNENNNNNINISKNNNVNISKNNNNNNNNNIIKNNNNNFNIGNNGNDNDNNNKVNLKNIFNNKQIKSPEEVKENNSSKSFFSSIGETLGFVAPTPPNASLTNNIKTNIQSECEGEDCDVFINSNKVSEIRNNLGNNFNNPKTRFKRARNTLNNLLGKEVNYSKKNRTGNLENIPQTGDMFTYLEKT